MTNETVTFTQEDNSLVVFMGEILVATFSLGETGSISSKVESEIASGLPFEDQKRFYAAVASGFIEAEDKLGVNFLQLAFNDAFDQDAREAYSKSYDLSDPEQFKKALKEYDDETGNSFIKLVNALLKFQQIPLEGQNDLERQLEWVFCLDGDYYKALAYVAAYGYDDLYQLQKDYSPFELMFMDCDSRYSDSKVRENLSTLSHFANKHSKQMGKALVISGIEELVEKLSK